MGIGIGDHLSFFFLLPFLLFLLISTFILVRSGKANAVETSEISFSLYNPGGGGGVSCLHGSWQNASFLIIAQPMSSFEVRKSI